MLLGRLDGLRMISIKLFSFVWFETLFDFNVPFESSIFLFKTKKGLNYQLIFTFRWKWYLGQVVLRHCIILIRLVRIVWRVVYIRGPDRPVLLIVDCRCDRRAIRRRKLELIYLIFSIIVFGVFQIRIVATSFTWIIIIIIVLCHEMIWRSRGCRVHGHWKIRRWTLNGRLQGRSIGRQQQTIAGQCRTRRVRVVYVQMLLQADSGRWCDIVCNGGCFGTVQAVAALGLFFASLAQQCVAAVWHSAVRMSRGLLMHIIGRAGFQFSRRQYCRCCVGRLVL